MAEPLLPLDDIDAHARAAWMIGADLCACEGEYHRVHPLLRRIGAMHGISSDRDDLNALLGDRTMPGERILIAGSADATLLRYFVENRRAVPLSITIVDRCPTPLRLIDRLALPPGVTVTTRQQDFASLDDVDAYDLILSHSMLTFIGEGARADVVRRLGAALRPQGRLIVVERIPQSSYAPTPEELADAWVDKIAAKLAPFPDLASFCGNGLMDSIRRNAATRVHRKHLYTSIGEIRETIAQAGLHIAAERSSGSSVTLDMPDGSPRSRLGHIFVATRESATGVA